MNMARVKLNLPTSQILGTYQIPVRITDINYGNHLSNNAIVEIIHEARVQFLQSHHFTELNAGGVALIMNELIVEYKNESFYNDRLDVAVFFGEITKISFELFYEISVNRNDAKIIIVHAKTGMVGYNYQEKKVAILTEELLAALCSEMNSKAN
jgi:acyl-CoA thioesterase FadM